MSVRGRPFTDRRGCSDETHLPCGRGSETRPPRSSLVDCHRVNAPNSTSANITTCSQTGVGDCTQANRVQAPGSASLKSSPSSSASRAAKVASSAVNGSASAVPVVPVVRRPACQASSDDWGSGAVVRGCVEPWTPDDWDDWDNWMIQYAIRANPRWSDFSCSFFLAVSALAGALVGNPRRDRMKRKQLRTKHGTCASRKQLLSAGLDLAAANLWEEVARRLENVTGPRDGKSFPQSQTLRGPN